MKVIKELFLISFSIILNVIILNVQVPQLVGNKINKKINTNQEKSYLFFYRRLINVKRLVNFCNVITFAHYNR